MGSEREVALLRRDAAALREAGDRRAADQLEAAANRVERTAAADLGGIRRGVFKLRDEEARPVPRPPRRRPPQASTSTSVLRR